MSDAKPLNGYVCFYNGKQVEVYAPTTAEAQRIVAGLLKVKEKFRYRISVHLAESANAQIVSKPTF